MYQRLTHGLDSFSRSEQIRNNVPCERDKEETYREHDRDAVGGGRINIRATPRLDQEHES